MADDTTLLPDAVADRGEAYMQRLGISGNDYSAVLQRSITRALADPADANPSPWAPFGARNIGGRIRVLQQDPLLPEVIYAGSAQGGVFRTDNLGDTWAPLGAPQDAFSVGALAVDQRNPQVLYVGSGETRMLHSVVTPAAPAVPFIQGSSSLEAGGVGLLRCDQSIVPAVFTTEVGPYTTAGPLPGAADQYARIVCDPNCEGRCWIASDTGLWRREPGVAPNPPLPPTFVKEPVPTGAPAVMPALPAPPALAPQTRPFGTNCCDVLVTPNTAPAALPGTYRIFAAFNAMGIFRGVYNPATGVTVWEAAPLSGGGVLPARSTPAGGTTHDRIRLCACKSQPQHVYAIFESGSTPGPAQQVLDVYYSNDGGTTWFASGPRPPAPPVAPPSVPNTLLGGQPWSHLIIEVHPDNPALVVAGATNLARSTDFGSTWQLVMDWQNWSAGDRAQHGDMHTLLFDAADPRRLFVGNDSGVLMTPDIVQGNPRTDQGWRKRSHGILCAQFNDVTVHPTYPWMVGGGLQDNGTYASFGGETWYVIGDADGGQMCFEVNDPRTFVAPNQSNILLSTVVAPTTLEPRPGFYPLVSRRTINGDREPPNDVFACQIAIRETAAVQATASLFLPLVEHHPSSVGHLLIGRGFVAASGPNPAVPADVFHSSDTLNTITPGNIPAAQIGNADVTALAWGNGTAATADWWVGTSWGRVLRRNSAGNWTQTPMPANAVNASVSRIVVHPRNSNYVAVCTTGVKAVWNGDEQGRVYLSSNRGASWTDISNVPVVGGSGLPPCPCTSLAFDPQPAANVAQTLFVGTMAGVYVCRNLPRIPAAPGAVPAFVPAWVTFNDRPARPPEPANPLHGRGPLPLTIVNDLKIVSLPARSGTNVIAGATETVARTRLIAAMYGRGMYVCDLTRTPAPGTPAGGPPVRLYIRQTVIEDGQSYPRTAPNVLNAAPGGNASAPRLGGDPRFPRLPAPVALTDTEAFDIRIDHAPFQFFEDVLDGVEFDEDLQTQALQAGASNFIYVQVHSAGWDAAGPVDVQLYFAAAPAPGQPNDAPLPDLHADFWAHWTDDPLPAPAAVPVAPAATWQRTGHAVRLTTISANQPAVARFEWVPPTNLGAHAALLAVCSGAADPLVPGTQPTVLATLLRRERRAALRVVPVVPFVPDLYIRDGLDDIGDLGGVAWGGRSPDIIVVPSAPADPATEYADIYAARSADRVQPGENFIYVRVHNRTAFATDADVELFWARPAPTTSSAAVVGGPASDNSQWQVVAAVGPSASVNVPAGGNALVAFHLTDAPAVDADVPGSLAFIALIRAHDGADLEPLRSRVTDLASFWRFFRELADANNAALRALRYA
jgi:hypothetical protein